MIQLLITDSQAAELLALTPRQVMWFASRGLLPSVVMPNKDRRYDPNDLRRWVASKKTNASDVQAFFDSIPTREALLDRLHELREESNAVKKLLNITKREARKKIAEAKLPTGS